MMSKSGGLNPRAVAGRPSVTRLTQRSCTGIRASGRPRAAVKKILCGGVDIERNGKNDQLHTIMIDCNFTWLKFTWFYIL